VTWSLPDVAGTHASRPTTDDVSTADSSCDDGKLPTGSGNRKQKCPKVEEDDDDWSSGNLPSLTLRSNEYAGNGRSRRQRRYADWAAGNKYIGRPTRSGTDLVAVGWNKRPRYYRQDGTTRDWRTNMMRVWGKRSHAQPIHGSARMTSLF